METSGTQVKICLSHVASKNKMAEDKIGKVCRENEDNYNYINFKQKLGREKNLSWKPGLG